MAYIWWAKRPVGTTQVNERQHAYVVKVVDYPIERPKTWRYTVEVDGTEAYIYIAKDSATTPPAIEVGNSLYLLTHWENSTIQGGKAHAYVRTTDWGILSQASIPWYHPLRIRHAAIERFRALGIDGKELQILSALTLGYKTELDRDTKQIFQRAGAAHILAVSGLHTGIVFAICYALFTFFGRKLPLYHETGKRMLLGGSLIVVIWLYAVLTGMSASVWRSASMLTIAEVGWILHRRAVSINTMLAAAIVILLFRPSELWSIGFWLSFSAVTALILMTPTTRGYWIGLIMASLAAQLGTLPISLHYFGQMSNYFLLTNLMVIPLTTGILALGISTLVMSWLPGINTLLALLTKYAIMVLYGAAHWVESLPGATTCIQCSFPMMLVLYAAIGMGILAFRRHIGWWLGVVICLSIWCILYVYE